MPTVLHSALTTTDLHEPKGIAAATSGKVYVSDGAGSGAWTTQVQTAFMNKHIAGLTWSNAADASNDITVLAGSCRDSTNTEDMILASSITSKAIDAAWVVGSTQGGFDNGSVSATASYHLYLIKRPDTGVVDVCFSASSTTPTFGTNIPAAYTKFRRIGSFYRQASVNTAVSVTEIEGGGIEVYRTGALVSTASVVAAATGTAVTLAQLPTNTSGLEAIFAARTPNNGNEGSAIAFSPTTVSMGDLSAGYGFDTIIAKDLGTDSPAYRPALCGRCRAVSGQVKFYSTSGDIIVSTLGWADPRRS